VKGRRFQSKYVIIAIPPHMITRIQFKPLLPFNIDQLLQAFPIGYALKFTVMYKIPFWRKLGFSGEAVSDNAPITLLYDTSPPDADELAKKGSFLTFLI
jgi:monoamine oxidase